MKGFHKNSKPRLRVCVCVCVVLVLVAKAHRHLLPGSCNFESGTCGYSSDPAHATWTVNDEGNDFQIQRHLDLNIIYTLFILIWCLIWGILGKNIMSLKGLAHLSVNISGISRDKTSFTQVFIFPSLLKKTGVSQSAIHHFSLWRTFFNLINRLFKEMEINECHPCRRLQNCWTSLKT